MTSLLILMVGKTVSIYMAKCDLVVHTDGADTICLDVLIRLLHPRGLGKNAVFMKRIEVSYLLVFTIIVICMHVLINDEWIGYPLVKFH